MNDSEKVIEISNLVTTFLHTNTDHILDLEISINKLVFDIIQILNKKNKGYHNDK